VRIIHYPRGRRWRALTAVVATSAITPLFLTGTAPSQAAVPPAVQLTASHGSLLVTHAASAPGAPGYQILVRTDPFQVVTLRAGKTVLATTAATTAASAPVTFTEGSQQYYAQAVQSYTWHRGVLTLDLSTTDPGQTVTYSITPGTGQYQTSWSASDSSVTEVGESFGLASGGYWYGQGETVTPQDGPYTNQPWPLNSGQVEDDDMGPGNYAIVTNPFWFTSNSSGLYVDTNNTMSADINANNNGLGTFVVTGSNSYQSTTFVGSTPRDVYNDYIAIAGKPSAVNVTAAQFTDPVWDDWGQMYYSVSQQAIEQYAEGLKANHIAANGILIDAGWADNYGLSFDSTTFPDPAAMSAEIHSLGYQLGLWVTLYLNEGTADFNYAEQHGYLLMSGSDPSQSCIVDWFGGPNGAGLVNLANPAAASWFAGVLQGLESQYDVNGFKFDTQFFDPSCTMPSGYNPTSYLKLAAQFTGKFNQMGVGVPINWTGSQTFGFAMREIDKSTDFGSLQAAIAQVLSLSTIGYPFVETDMIGGSLGGPAPAADVLVRWAEAAALTPIMYSSTSPADGAYDQQTINLYRKAIALHQKLAPYIIAQAKNAVATGSPIMQPLFFDFPNDKATYTISDEWMLGPSLLAAPVLTAGTTRDITLPPGWWYDVTQHRVIRGGTTLTNYQAGLGTIPMFVRMSGPSGGHGAPSLPKSLAWLAQ
jgi:alpha-glucosidase (family GH31 glycosyl hydrolase)